MTEFSKDIFDKIILQFLNELQVKNEIYKEKIEVNIIDITRESKKFITDLTPYIGSLSLYKSFDSHSSIKIIMNKLSYFEVVLTYMITDKSLFTDDIICLFLKMLGYQCYANAASLENIININFYTDYIRKIIKLTERNQYNYSDNETELLMFIKRCYYLSYHEANFSPNEKCLNTYLGFILDDIKYLQKNSLEEYFNILYEYGSILLDHKIYGIYEYETYINEETYKSALSEIKDRLKTPLNDEKIVFLYSSLLFRDEVYNLKNDIKNKIVIEEKRKKNLIIKCTFLIELFYRDKSNPAIFLDAADPSFNMQIKDVLTLFSKQMVRLLNDTENNVNNILFIIFLFLSNFNEYLKLNINIYNRINFILKKNYNRRIYIISTILYLRTIKDVESLKIELARLKKSIEKSPISSLIYLYNSETGNFYLLPESLKSAFKINSIIIEINEKMYYIHKVIIENIIKFRDNYKSSADYNVKLEYLMIFYNEMKNIFKVVEDPYLVTDVAKLYGYFIDNYIASRNMDYREDYLTKSTIIKMSIFDINPMTFAMSLLFSKLGKLSLFLNHQEPRKLNIKKKILTNPEKEQLIPFIDLSLDYLPKEESGYDWDKIEGIIKEIRNKALSSKNMTPPESRIIKVICAFFNKLTRQEEQTLSVFSKLYDEAFVKIYNYWDLDPIFIYYLNIYFSKKGKQEFIGELTGDKFDITIPRINNSVILDEIYNYVEDLLEYTNMSNNEVLGMLDEVSKDQKEYLIDENLIRKKKSTIELAREIKRNVLFIYEVNYFEITDKLYLSDILKNILLISGKSNIINPLLFALDELIDFFQMANYKRVYFEHKNIDMDIRYSLGILNFTSSLKENYNEFKEKIKSKKYKIKVTFQVFKDELIVSVSNDYKLHKEEIKEINEQIQTGIKNINLKEILKLKEFSMDHKKYELIVILLFLKKFSIEKSLKLSIVDNESRFTLNIPLSSISEEEIIKLSEEIVKEIERIPQIPEHISELKKKIDDPKSEISDIEKIILKDPALTADILKTANSSYYALGKEINSINEAVKVVGLKAINNIILVTSSYKLLNDKVSKEKMDMVIKHSEKTAFFARELLKYKKISINEGDIYLASLLHDIGKIVVEGLNPGVYEKLQSIFDNKKLSVDFIEDIAGGLNHALIGGMISVKWNFPDIVTEIIRCHHNPRNVNKYPDAVFIVYLSNILTHYIDNKIVYESIDENVLEFLEIESEEKLKKIAFDINRTFDIYKKKG